MPKDAPLDPPPHNPMPNREGKAVEPPSMTPMVTGHGAIDTSGVPDVDESGLPASRIIGHEQYEVGLRGVFQAMGWFVVTLIITFVAVYVTMFGFKDAEMAAELPKTGITEPAPLSPEPRLQPSRGHEILEWDERQRTVNQWKDTLSSYGWVDEKSQTVHIPIDKAIELAVKDPKTLPARAGGERPAR